MGSLPFEGHFNIFPPSNWYYSLTKFLISEGTILHIWFDVIAWIWWWSVSCSCSLWGPGILWWCCMGNNIYLDLFSSGLMIQCIDNTSYEKYVVPHSYYPLLPYPSLVMWHETTHKLLAIKTSALPSPCMVNSFKPRKTRVNWSMHKIKFIHFYYYQKEAERRRIAVQSSRRLFFISSTLRLR